MSEQKPPRCTRHYEHVDLKPGSRHSWTCRAPGHPPYSIDGHVIHAARFLGPSGERDRETLRALGVSW